MRIALIAPFGLRAKGTARARALPLGAALARRGHTVALFVPPYDSPEDAGRSWDESGVQVVNIALSRWPAGSVPWHLRLAWRLFQAVRNWRPEVVHVFKPKGPSGLVGAALWIMRGGRRKGRPRRVAPTDPVSLSPCLLILDSDDWEGPGGWNDDLRAGYSPLQRWFFAWQERFGLSHADAWTVTSRCLRERAIAFGADAERVFVLPNGAGDFGFRMLRPGSAQVSDFGFEEWQSAIGNRQSVILYTRFAGVRGADVVALWERVRARAPDATLTVVGRGLGGEQRELAGLPEVEVVGWVELENLPALFARMTVAVVPWADTPVNRARSSAKVLELMAAGVPAVAYAVGELSATVGDGGVLVPAGDIEAFAAAVAGLLADPERARALGARGRERVLREYNWDHLAEIALEAYAAGLGGDRAALA